MSLASAIRPLKGGIGGEDWGARKSRPLHSTIAADTCPISSLDQQGQGISLRKAGLDKTLPEVLPTLFVEEGLAATPIGGGEGGIILQIFLYLGLGLLHPPQLGEGGSQPPLQWPFSPLPSPSARPHRRRRPFTAADGASTNMLLLLGSAGRRKKPGCSWR